MQGIKNNIFNFIKNFLHTRTIQVKIAYHLSSSRIIENSVPQESVLSVSLFLIAINDVMTNLSNLVKGFLFVDDLTIICRGRNLWQNKIMVKILFDQIVTLHRGGNNFSTNSHFVTEK